MRSGVVFSGAWLPPLVRRPSSLGAGDREAAWDESADDRQVGAEHGAAALSTGSQLDRFEPVLRRLSEEWPQIKAPPATELLRDEYAYDGSVELVKRRLRELRPRTVRPTQRTGYRPGQVLQFDWAVMPTRPTLAGRERRVYALVASLPTRSRKRSSRFHLSMESFLEGHVRAFEWPG